MNRIQLLALAMVVIVLGCLVDESTAEPSRRRSRGRGGFRFQQRRREQQETENRRACFALSGLFTRRGCMEEVDPVCRMFAFLIKNGDFDCEQFPCNGYGDNSRSVCVEKGTCTRLTLSNGLCTRDTECCIPANQ